MHIHMHMHMHSSVGTIIVLVSQNHSITKKKRNSTVHRICMHEFAIFVVDITCDMRPSRLFPPEVARLHDARNGHSPVKAW